MAKKKAASKKTASKKTASKKVASKKAVSKKTASKKTTSKKTASKKKAKSAVADDRRQVNVMLDEKTINKLDKLRAKHSTTRSDLIINLVKTAS